MAKNENSTKKFSVFELVSYIIAGLLALWGLTYLVLGLIGMYIDVIPSKNVLQLASDSLAKHFGLGFFAWGLILLSIGALLAIIILCVFAKRSDRVYEREARRAARRNRLSQELAAASNVNDAKIEEIKPAEEAAPKEEKVEESSTEDK